MGAHWFCWKDVIRSFKLFCRLAGKCTLLVRDKQQLHLVYLIWRVVGLLGDLVCTADEGGLEVLWISTCSGFQQLSRQHAILSLHLRPSTPKKSQSEEEVPWPAVVKRNLREISCLLELFCTHYCRCAK